jgi:hypothetical protein
MIDRKSHWVKDYTYYDPFSSSHCHWGRNQAGFNLSLSGRVFLTDNRVVKPSDFIYDPATGRYRERESFLSQETADYPNHRDLIDGYGKDLTVYGGIYSWDKGKTGFYLYPNTVEALNDDMKRGLASLIGVHKITERTPVYVNSSKNLLFRLGDIASRTPYENPTRSAIDKTKVQPHKALSIKFDANVWGKWQTISDFHFPGGGYSTAFVRQHKNVELRHGYPFQKVSLVQVSGKGNAFVITAQTSSHSVFPQSPSSRYGETAPVKGQTGIRLFHVEETAPNLKVALMKAESLKKTMVQRFEKVTRDTMPVKNPEELPEEIRKKMGLPDRLIYPLKETKENYLEKIYRAGIESAPIPSLKRVKRRYPYDDDEMIVDTDIAEFTPNDDPYSDWSNITIKDKRYEHEDKFKPLEWLYAKDRDKTHLWRGMSGEEWQDIVRRGYIESKGDYNFTNQKGLTYFSYNPGQALHYASSFAPWQYTATWKKPAVVIQIKWPAEDRLVIEQPPEVGVKGRIPLSDIEKIFELRIAAEEPGRIDVIETGRGYSEGSRTSTSHHLIVREVPPSEWATFIWRNPLPAGMAHLGDEAAAAEAMNPKFVVAPYRQGVDGFVWYIPKKTTLYVTPDTLKESPITISHEYGHWANRRIKKSFRGLNLKLDYNSEMQLRIFWNELAAWEWALNRAPAKSVDQVHVRHCLMTYIPDQFGDYEIRLRMYKLIEDFLNRYESKFTRNTYKRKNPIESDGLMLNLADHAMALFGGDLEGTVAWLVKIGAKDVIWETDTDGRKISASLTGPSGMRVGIIPTDPVNCSIILGMAIANMYWPQAFPGLLKEVNRRWKETQYSRAGKK